MAVTNSSDWIKGLLQKIKLYLDPLNLPETLGEMHNLNILNRYSNKLFPKAIHLYSRNEAFFSSHEIKIIYQEIEINRDSELPMCNNKRLWRTVLWMSDQFHTPFLQDTGIFAEEQQEKSKVLWYWISSEKNLIAIMTINFTNMLKFKH